MKTTTRCRLLRSQVAKSVSLRLYNELEVVQKKNSRLEWTNEALSEKIQQLEVVKQVLQSEVEKSREVRCHVLHHSSRTADVLFLVFFEPPCAGKQMLL